MRSRIPTFIRLTVSLVAIISLTLSGNQAATAEQAPALPKSAGKFHKITVKQLAQSFENASEEDLQNCIKRITNDRSISAEDWQKLLVALRDTMCESKKDREKLHNKLCSDVQAATDLRFGKNSLESAMGHLTYAISFSLLEENRRTWDEYDKAVSSGKLTETNPDFLVKSMEKLGVNFFETSYYTDAVHTYKLADQIVASQKVSLPVQADLYNTGTDKLFRCSYGIDDHIPLFYKFADKAIRINRQLGSKYSDELPEVLHLKRVQMDDEKEYEIREKKFRERQEAYQKSLETSENNQ